jgi:transcriptional regulator with XRE-family HTH domain
MNESEVPSEGGTSPSDRSLRAVRSDLGLSLRAVAAKAHIDPAQLSRIERGEAQLTVEVLYRLAVALELEALAYHLEPHRPQRQQTSWPEKE